MKKLRRQSQRFEGLSVGLDLHQQYTQVSVLDEAGDEQLSERIASRPEAVAALLDRLTAQGVAVQVALEASGCFLWAYDLLIERLGRDCVLTPHPQPNHARLHRIKIPISSCGQETFVSLNDGSGLRINEARLPAGSTND